MPASLKSRIPEITAQIRPRVNAAVKEAAILIVDDAQARVPVDTGDLFEAIHYERRAQGSYAVVAGGEGVYYGHIVENGSVNTAARPFLVPAAEANRFNAEALVTGALRGLALRP